MFYTAFPVWVYFLNLNLGTEFFKFMALYLLSVWENSLPQSCPNIVLSHSPFLPHSGKAPHSNTLELSAMIHFFPPYLFHPFPRPSVWAFLVNSSSSSLTLYHFTLIYFFAPFKILSFSYSILYYSAEILCLSLCSVTCELQPPFCFNIQLLEILSVVCVSLPLRAPREALSTFMNQQIPWREKIGEWKPISELSPAFWDVRPTVRSCLGSLMPSPDTSSNCF